MNTIKNILLTAVTLTMLSSYATELNPTRPSNQVTAVTFNNVKKGQQLTIIDSEATVLYQEKMKNNGTYAKKFDLSTLKNGNYSIELDQSVQIVTRYFEVSNGIVNFDNTMEQVFFKPVAIVKEDRLLVSQWSTTDEALDVEIYYNNDLIQEETLSDSNQLGRIYQLSKENSGSYTVVMKSSGKTFYKVFEF